MVMQIEEKIPALVGILYITQLIFPAGAVLLSFILFLASSISFSSKKNVFGDCGIPEKAINPMKAMGMVMMPSIIKSHFQPLRHPTPLRFV